MKNSLGAHFLLKVVIKYLYLLQFKKHQHVPRCLFQLAGEVILFSWEIPKFYCFFFPSPSDFPHAFLFLLYKKNAKPCMSMTLTRMIKEWMGGMPLLLKAKQNTLNKGVKEI